MLRRGLSRYKLSFNYCCYTSLSIFLSGVLVLQFGSIFALVVLIFAISDGLSAGLTEETIEDLEDRF